MNDRDDQIDRNDAGTGEHLSDDLAELHRELEGLRIRERASFGPELRAELRAAWEEEGEASPSRPRPSVRSSALLAASVGGILLLGLTAPQARAALADIVDSVSRGFVELVRPEPREEEVEVPAVPSLGAVDVRVPEETAAPPEVDEDAPAQTDVADEAVAVESPPEVAFVFPDLLDREAASRIVQSFYPDALAGRAVAGTVGLRMYVDSGGRVDRVELVRSSGVDLLDDAALRAAPSLRFRPARSGSSPVGTWVELGIDFSADPFTAPEAAVPPSR